MTRQQRFKYEMFVRVRDFGAAHAALFPEASKGKQAFARVLAAVTALDEQQKAHLLGLAEARRIKAVTRDAVFDYMKTIAAAARRVTQQDPAESPFVLPRKRRLSAELASARVFMAAAASRQKDFEAFGLPATFIAHFRALVDQLQQAADVRLSSRTQDPTTFAAWTAARQIEGQRDRVRKVPVRTTAPQPAPESVMPAPPALATSPTLGPGLNPGRR